MARHLCVFCGGRVNSKEHVIPGWIDGVFRGHPRKKRIGDLRHVLREHNGDKAWTGKFLSLTVRCVCRSCNNGWMDHEIERPARPSLEPMILGGPVTLDRTAQERVAAWAIKTAAMTQLARSGPQPLRDDLRAALYERHVAPAACRVWLAALVRTPNPLTWGSVRGLPAIGAHDPATATGQMELATIAIGQLVLHSLRWSGVELDELVLPHAIEQLVLPVWPVEAPEITWPPDAVLDGRESLRNFAEAWEP
jgi:hypothetical protein